MLIITNGDSAAATLRGAGLEHPILPWRDLLHEGPVPVRPSLEALSQLRARFLAEQGWGRFDEILADFQQRDATLRAVGAEDEVLLWFEHDLYDQLQLIQLLHYFQELETIRRPRLHLICEAEFIALSRPGRLRDLFARRKKVSDQHLELSRSVWSAFVQESPQALIGLLEGALGGLPFLQQALQRLLQEYPAAAHGLSRTQQQILEAVEGRAPTPVQIFQRSQDCEEARYLGDTTFWSYLQQLSSGPHPLIATLQGGRFEAPVPGDSPSASPLTLTPDGRRVWEGEADWVELNGIDRWLGGVHLRPGRLWRRRPSGCGLFRADR